MLAPDALDRPFPEGKRLGVRVVDAKDAHAVVDPVDEHIGKRLPERAPVVGLEVERVDILIFLWRVLGVLHAAVGTPFEPLRMALYPRMVGCALEGDVERDLEPQLAR